MADRMEMTPQQEFQELALRLQAAGHTIIHERSTFRHRAFKQDFHPETIIRVRKDGSDTAEPLLTSLGNTVKVSQVYPERADLCLDADGVILNEAEFAKRYKAWLEVTLPDFCTPDAEPIPDPAAWIIKIRDPFSESPGPVEVDYDARKPAEKEATHMYNPQTDELIERIASGQESQSAALLVALEELKELRERSRPGRPKKSAAPIEDEVA